MPQAPTRIDARHRAPTKNPAMLARALSAARSGNPCGQLAHGGRTPRGSLESGATGGAKSSKRLALLILGEAQFRIRDNGRGRTRAAGGAHVQGAGATVYQGRALWAPLRRAQRTGELGGRDRAANARWGSPASGDMYGIGNAINMLTFHEPDIAVACACCTVARRVPRSWLRRAPGGRHPQPRQPVRQLGLYRRARRYSSRPPTATGAQDVAAGLATTIWTLAHPEHELGDAGAAGLTSSRRRSGESAGRRHARPPIGAAYLASVVGRRRRAARCALTRKHCARWARPDEVALEINALTGSVRGLSQPPATPRGARRIRARQRIHRSHDLADIQGSEPTELWWQHSGRCAPTAGRSSEASPAVAYRIRRRPIPSSPTKACAATT